MIGARRGQGGSFRFGLLAWEMMKDKRRQHKTLITIMVISFIPPVIDVSE